MALVKQVRVLRNVLCFGLLCVLALGLVRDRFWEHHHALGIGVLIGGCHDRCMSCMRSR